MPTGSGSAVASPSASVGLPWPSRLSTAVGATSSITGSDADITTAILPAVPQRPAMNLPVG